MESQESKKESSDGEDIPSDFFDDFTREDFMDGLSVIDSWNNEEKPRSRRIDEDAVNSVNDLRELIAKEDKLDSSDPLDDYIKPGSRRDPSKTKQAIKRDKEEKVKEFLAKHLESTDDLCPPGTELDDYYDESVIEKHKIKERGEREKRLAKERYEIEDGLPFKYHEPGHYKHREGSYRNRRESPLKLRYKSPVRHRKEFSPKHRHESPVRFRHGFHREERHPVPRRGRHYSPLQQRSPRFSQRRPPHNHHWSPRRSPLKPRRYRQSPEPRRSRSRSHYKRTSTEKRSRSPSKHGVEKDDFLYPEKYRHTTSKPMQIDPQYGPPEDTQYKELSYPYPQRPCYTGFNEPYFPSQLEPPVHTPQPVPAPNAHAPPLNPSMIPAPCMASIPMHTQVQPKTCHLLPINPIASQILESTPASPYDALAKLVADGKLSHEDYLKLAPNKGVTTNNMDPKERVTVLNRCSVALSKLGNLKLPNRLMINNMLIGQEQKAIAPKYVSPLKRQSAVEFHFSKMYENSSVTQRNKQIVESIIWALSLDKVVGASKKRTQKDVQEVSVQTSKAICEVCEIRETTKFCDASTSTEPEYFSSSVHTQVIEEDLFSSKAVFNPSGSSSGGSTISIAHLTPAQLVSQLAARAKTLKQTDQPQSSPRGNRPNFDYDYDYSRRGGSQYQNSNYGNYRY